MTEGNEFHPPKIYAIWVDARPESPMAGLSGFLSENSRRLFFTERGDAELKIRDMEALRRDLTRVLDSYFVLDDKPCRVFITRKRQKDGSYLRDVRIEVSARGVRRMAMHP